MLIHLTEPHHCDSPGPIDHQTWIVHVTARNGPIDLNDDEAKAERTVVSFDVVMEGAEPPLSPESLDAITARALATAVKHLRELEVGGS